MTSSTISSVKFPSPPKRLIRERDIVHVLLECGDNYIFKPDKPEDDEREGHCAQREMEVYDRFRHLQGKCIPICYGIASLDGEVGLLLQDCGRRTFEYPPSDKNSKFILYMRATCVMSQCLRAGLVHPDMEFRNIVYNLKTLQVRFIDIEPVRYAEYTPEDMWKFLDGGFFREFGYGKTTVSFYWGFSGVLKALMAYPCDLSLYFLILQFCLCLVRKKFMMRNEGKL